MVFEFLRRGGRTGPRHVTQDDQPATEPLAAIVAAALDTDAHTTPVPRARSAPRSKKPRVSFNSVTSTTFVTDGADPFKLSSPQERMLSPLLDNSLISSGSNDAAAAMASGQQGQKHDELDEQYSKSPVRPRTLSEPSDMAVSVAAASSPGEVTGELTGEVTCDIADVSQVIADDEMENPGVPNQPRAHLSPAPAGWNNFPRFQDQKSQLSDDEESVASRRVERQGAAMAQSSDTANLGSAIHQSTRDADEATTGSTSYSGLHAIHEMDVPIVPAAAAGPRAESAHQAHFVQMPGSSALHVPPRISVADSVASFDFEAVNQEFDRRVGIAPQSSPMVSPLVAHTSVARDVGNVRPGAAGGVFQAPGLSLLANLRASPASRSPGGSAGRFPARRGSRSPGGSAGRFPQARSPQRDFVKWTQGTIKLPELSHQAFSQHSGQLSESGQSSEQSTGTLVQHPIAQLTSSTSGTRTRMSWEEFMGHGMHEMCGTCVREHDEAPAPTLETSVIGCAPTVFDCPRAQELHEALQQRRLEYLESFVDQIVQDTDQRRNEYSVAKQMWDRSTEMPSVASELIQVSQDGSEKDAFIVRMKDWQKQCKEKALQKWYGAKRQWLEGDRDIVAQHTQTLKDEVQRLSDAKHKCQEMLKDIHSGSKKMQHLGDLHEIKYAYQEFEASELHKMQEDQQHLRRTLSEAEAELDAERQKNTDIDEHIQQLKQQIQAEEANTQLIHREAVQQQLQKNFLEKQLYAHTCIIQKATSGAVCLQLRGSVKLWVENPTGGVSETVRVSVQQSTTTNHMNPCIRISPELRSGWMACAWSRVLAVVNGSGAEKILGPIPGHDAKHLESVIPCQEVQRFLRLFDVEVLHMTDQLRAMRDLQKDVPEVHQLSAEFHNGPLGDQRMAKLTILLSVMHSHSIMADGTLRPLTTEAKRGKFEAVQCVLKFNADLAASTGVSWSAPTVEPVLGHLDAELVAQAVQSVPSGASFREVVKATAAAMKSTAQWCNSAAETMDI